MRDTPAFDDEDLWFPAHMSAGDSFSRPLAADGAAMGAGAEDDGIGLPRRRPGTGPGGPRKRNPKNSGINPSSWLWLTLWGAAALGIATYAARKEIATELAQGWLKGQGVPAQLHFDALSLDHASGRFMLGDPQHPDVSVGRFDATFSLNPFASGGRPSLRLTQAHLDHVLVHLSYKDGKLGFGTLDRLVHNLSVGPKTPSAPPKDITLENAEVVVDSDYGVIRGHGGAALRDGRLSYLSLKLPAARLDGAHGGGDFGGGDILVRPAGESQLQVEARLNAAQVDLHDGSRVVEGEGAHRLQAQGLGLDLSARVPYGDNGVLSGPLDAVLAVTARDLRGKGLVLADGETRLKLDGRLHDGAQYDGAADIQATAGHVNAQGVDVHQATVSASGLDVHVASGSIRLKGPVRAGAGRIRRAGMAATNAHLKADRFEWTGDTAGSHADFAGTATAGSADAGDLTLSQAHATVDAALDSDNDSGAWHLKAQADLDTGGSYSGLHALARGRTTDDDIARLGRGLDHFQAHASGVTLTLEGQGDAAPDIDLRLKAPIAATLDGGLTLNLTPRDGAPLLASHAMGGFAVTLTGGPKIALDLTNLTLSSRGTIGGNYSLDGAFTVAPVTGAVVSAKGRFSTGDGLAVTLSQPLVFSAQSAQLGETVTHLSGTFTQGGSPLLRVDAGGWRLDGAVSGLSLQAPNEQLALSDAHGAVSAFSIAGSPVTGLKAGLDTAVLNDTAPDQRFHTLVLSGGLTQDARALTGRFTAAATVRGKPVPVVAIALDNDNATGRGQLGLHTLGLTFAPGGLQPRDLSQMGTAVLAKNVSGGLSFDGAFRWEGRKTTSSGVLKLDGLSFAGAVGTAQNLTGEIDFTSLAPLQSAPGQVLGIYRMDVGLPLSDLAMSLQFQGDRIAIEKATVNTPGGPVRLEPMSVAFDPSVPISGAASFDGLDFGKVIATTGLSNSLTFEGKLSGRVPFSILGGHVSFADGWMRADGPGTISIQRQALTGVAASGSVTGDGQAQAAALEPAFNPFQDLAYQAMEHLHYDQLDAKINSQPGGVLDTTFHLKGRFAPPQAQKAQISLLDYLNGTWTQKPLKLPSDTPVELTLDVPVNLDDILDSLAQFSK